MSKLAAELAAQIEALLFASPTPLPLKELAALIEQTEASTLQGIEELKGALKGRGLGVVESGEGYELAIQPAFREVVKKLDSTAAPNLSASGMEVLSIIAYDGPLEKPEIDSIRGTPSDATLRSLLSRDLILQISSRSSSDSYQYELTSFAWRCLGLHGRGDLPPKPKELADAPQ